MCVWGVCTCVRVCATLPPPLFLQVPPSSSAHLEQHHRQQQGTTPSSSLLPIPSLLGQSATLSLSPASKGTLGGRAEPMSSKTVPPSPLHHALAVTPSEAAVTQQQQQVGGAVGGRGGAVGGEGGWWARRVTGGRGGVAIRICVGIRNSSVSTTGSHHLGCHCCTCYQCCTGL